MSESSHKRGRPKSAEKHQQILEASSRLFLECGFTNTSMDTVAQRAGVSKQTLYSHFDNKASLFRACIESKVREYGLDLSAVNHDEKIAVTLAHIAGHLMDLFHDSDVRDMYRVLMAESHSQPELCRLFYEAGPLTTKTALATYLTAQRTAGKIAVRDPFDAAELFISMIETSFLTKVLLGIDMARSDAERASYINGRVEDFMKLLG